MRSRLHVLASLALGATLGLALLTGCGGADANDAADPGQAVERGSDASSPAASPSAAATSPGSARPSEEPSAVDVPPVPEVLDFTGTLVDGSSFDGATLAGNPVVVWFWAPWCPVCRSQVPDVQAAASEYAGEVGVIGIGSLDDATAIAGFAAEAPGVLMLQDPEGALWRHFGITEQSTFVVLDDSGREVARTSYGEDLDLAAILDDLAG